MNLCDLVTGSAVVLRSYYGDGSISVDLRTNVIATYSEGVLLDSNDSSFNSLVFSSPDRMRVDVYFYPHNAKPEVWANVGVAVMSTKNLSGYLIAGKSRSTNENRRYSVRVTLDTLGVLSISDLGKTFPSVPVRIHDISSGGFSIVTNKYIALHCEASIFFTDIERRFSHEGYCVRKQPLENGSILYGFLAPRRHNEIDKYIKYRLKANSHNE